MPVVNRISDFQADIAAWRQDIHAHPELQYEVHRTAAFVAARIIKRIRPGQITLMHVSCVTSAQALPRIFDYLDKNGMHVVPVSTLMTEAEQPGAPDKSVAFRK